MPCLLYVNQCLYRGAPAAHFGLMGALDVVIREPVIQVLLQFVNGVVNLPPKRDLIELLQNRFVKALADAIGLWMTHLGLRMLDII